MNERKVQNRTRKWRINFIIVRKRFLFLLNKVSKINSFSCDWDDNFFKICFLFHRNKTSLNCAFMPCGWEKERERKWKKYKTVLLWTKPIYLNQSIILSGLWRSPNKTNYKHTENRGKKNSHSNKLIDTNTSYSCVGYSIPSLSIFLDNFFVIVSAFLRNWSIYFVCCLSTWLLFRRRRHWRQGESARFWALHNSLW